MKVIIRDQSGKYAWRFKYYELIDNTFLDKQQENFEFKINEESQQKNTKLKLIENSKDQGNEGNDISNKSESPSVINNNGNNNNANYIAQN